MAVLKVPAVVKLQENVIDEIYNFAPDKAPLVSMIPTQSVHNVFFEWQRDIYSAARQGEDNERLRYSSTEPLRCVGTHRRRDGNAPAMERDESATHGSS